MMADGTRVRVRPMTARDAEVVADLSGQLGYPSTTEQIRGRLEALSRDPESAVYIAEDERRRVVGWAHVAGKRFLELDPFAELEGLVVDATARRAGIGKALAAASEAWAAGKGYAVMRVRSNVKRGESHPFYEGIGYAWVKSQHVYEKRLKFSKQHNPAGGTS